MSSAKEEKQANSIHSLQDLYLKTLHGQELSPLDALTFGLVDSLLGSVEKTSPYGSRDSDWISEEGNTYGLTYAERNTMYTQADRLLRADPMMLNAHKRFIMHVCGGVGRPSITLAPINGQEHPLTKRLAMLIPDFPALATYIVSYTLKFGELYSVHFPLAGTDLGRPRPELFTPDKCRKIHVETPGALRSPVQAYNFPALRKTAAYKGKAGLVPASAVTMFKVHEDLNDGLHGLSLYYVAMREVMPYADWLHSRVLRARANSIFLILRALKGPAPGESLELPDKPMIVDTHMGHEQWTTIEAGGSARDASSDGHEFRMRAAQGVGLPEPDISADAQFGAQVQQSYATRLYEYYQQALTPALKRYVALTIGITDLSELILTWDYVDPRDRSARVTEVEGLARDRVISRAAVHRRLGYDHELMETELKKELAEEANVGMQTTAPGQLPLEFTPPLPPTEAPSRPSVVPATKETASPEPIVEKALPSGMLSAAGVTDTGMVPSDVTEAAPAPSEMMLGIDYGYAKNGAILLGGPSKNGYSVVGEIWLHRAPLTGEGSWEETLTELHKLFPEMENVYIGSDAPEIVDIVKQLGFTATIQKQGIPEAIAAIKRLKASGSQIAIHPRCKRLIGELFPSTQDKGAESHVAASNDFFDALRYLVLGSQVATNERHSD